MPGQRLDSTSQALRREAEGLARLLCAASQVWGAAFAQSAGGDRPALRDALATEVLAYALCLTQLRLERLDEGDSRPFLQAVRRACWARETHPRSQSPGGAWRMPLPAEAAADRSGFTPCWLAREGTNAAGFQLTEEAFRDFCQTTGLGADGFVGKGANLAALVFYLILHGRVAHDGPLSREQKTRLLATARECRGFLEGNIARWLTRRRAWGSIGYALPLVQAIASRRPAWQLSERSR